MKKLEVRLSLSPNHEQLVGHLAEHDRRVYFEYDSNFLARPLWLSPFKLPPEPGLHEHKELAFGPLFGLFDDSLPDGWGLLLMDRHLKAQGFAPAAVSPLDRLAYHGTRTMGALTYHPPQACEDGDPAILDLHALSLEAHRIISGQAQEILPLLLRAGGSPGGARPKVLVGVSEGRLICGADELPPGYAHWLIKFAARQDADDDGVIELAYAEMARASGIDMPPTRLFATAEGDRFFGVARFDRDEDERFHVHTFGNLIHANFRIPGSDYEQLLHVTRVLTKDERAVHAMLRRMIFNVLAHNRDDHVKNFAFRLNRQNEWELAPAYDLTFADGPGGEHTMTVDGEGRRPGRTQFARLAERFDIPQKVLSAIIDEVAAAAADWPRFAKGLDVSEGRTREIQKALEEDLSRL